jgi:hypothetical protein
MVDAAAFFFNSLDILMVQINNVLTEGLGWEEPVSSWE